MERLRFVIVGAGRAGGELHLEALAALDSAEVLAICDPDVERARQVAEAGGVPHACASLQEALEQHRADAVSICSPPQFHLEQALAALEAGAHVLVEKPIAMTPADAEQMKAHADKEGLKLQVVHNYKFRPGVRQGTEAVRNGRVGEVFHVEVTWFTNPDRDRMMQPGFWCHELTGGRWAETLPHQLYIPYQWVGPLRVSHVVVKERHGRWPYLPGEEVLAVLENRAATLAVRLSENAAVKQQHILVCGSKGALYGDYSRMTPLPLPVPRPPAPVQRGARRQVADAARAVLKAVRKRLPLLGRAEVQAQLPPPPPPKKPPPAHLPIVEGFVNHVLRGAPEPVPWEEAIWTMRTTYEIGEKIERAAGRRVGPADAGLRPPAAQEQSEEQ
jgi:predicted dehydrogenase